ncbi:MAG: DegT/DnrJ/EryC1/StrS family aminotransferase [Nitrospinota bacterium]
MNKNIPLLDLGQEIDEIYEEVHRAIDDVIKSRRFVLGPNVEAFEKETADYLGVKHAVGVNSGTDALIIGLRCLGIGQGDEVITTPFTFAATAEAVSLVGAKPVFADIDPNTYNIDPSLIEEKINCKTKAIIPVHLFGQGAEMDLILDIGRKHDLKIIEDAAQGIGGEYKGKKLGSLGNVGGFSFFPSKNLGGFGDGGLITTNSEETANSARMLREHGSKTRYSNEVVGYNSRLDEIQAAILRVKLPRLDKMNEGRRKAAKRYDEMLAGISEVVIPTGPEFIKHIYNLYTIRILDGKRDLVKNHLLKAGITSVVYYPTPVNKLPPYRDGNSDCPQSDKASEEVLSLPIWPFIHDDVQQKISNEIKKSLKS